jgi:hypothetical protein
MKTGKQNKENLSKKYVCVMLKRDVKMLNQRLPDKVRNL